MCIRDREKGHQVTLYEASDKLGGNMRLAAYPPGKGDITNMIRSYIVRCQKAGVTIKMNQEVTLDLIREEKPDSVIVASGSRTLILPIEGIDNPAIIHGSDLLDGKRAAGKKVLVVGGGMVGCETAAFLGEQNHDVTVIEFRDKMCIRDRYRQTRIHGRILQNLRKMNRRIQRSICNKKDKE